MTLLAIVALASVAWMVVDRGLLAGGRYVQTLPAAAGSATLPRQTDAEPSTAPTARSDHATPSTLTATAPSSAEAVSTAAPPSPASEPPESSGSRFAGLERRARAGDRKAARDWAEAVMECGATTYGAEVNAKPSHVSHLNWSLVEQRFELRAELLGSLVDECRQLFPPADQEQAMLQWQSMVNEALELWAASGDPYGQLVDAHRERSWPPPLDEWRAEQALAAAHLDPRNPQTLVDLGEAFAEGSRFMSEAWTLAACDLGYDCSAGGALHRRMCLNQMFCFEGSFEEVSLRLLSPRQWQIVQAQRRALLAMLQRGETAAIFDVPPPGP